MKHTFFLAIAALFFTASVNAQSTVDSIAAKYTLLPMPQALTLEKTFPAIGTYELTTGDVTSTVTITLDEANKGLVWIEGLPEGKMKAYLKKSPASYRILAQKTESGKQIQEGTLIFDSTTNVLNIALGAPFKDEEPTAVFASLTTTVDADAAIATAKTKTTSKTKAANVKFYTANKVVAQQEEAVTNNTFSTELQKTATSQDK